jgi:GH25 family lysozyme M1 (1,4-beta-N-acetylmuramidase)
MDFKAKRVGILLVLCAVVVVMGAVVLANYDSLVNRNTKEQDTANSNSQSQLVDENGMVRGSNLQAFLLDDDFFDSESEEETTTDEDGVEELSVVTSSVERDIRVKIIDSDGEAVSGQKFMVTVADTGVYVDDDMDGLITISDIKPGTYQVSLNELEGFKVPEAPAQVRVKSIISYVAIDDIGYYIHSESELSDVSGEDCENTQVEAQDEDDTQYTTLLDVESDKDSAVQIGIDVSKWNGDIDWEIVKAEGVDFAIIRCGYRGSTSGWLIEDPYFYKNIQGAKKAGIKVGVYFFTQATDLVEAVEEASMVISLIGDIELDYPVFIDTEGAGGNGRADGIDAGTRTAIVNAFCQTMKNSGYKSGVYASCNWLLGSLNPEEMYGQSVWLAEYRQTPKYEGTYDMWQYTSKGSVAGIEGRVDLDISYLGIE